MPKASLQLFGQFRLTGVEGSLSLTSSQVLLALLVQEQGREWSRTELAEAIWPGQSPSNRGRLRTALAGLRTVLGQHARWNSSRSTLQVEFHDLEVDLWEAKKLVRQIRSTIAEAEEAVFLQKLDSVIGKPFFSDQTDFCSAMRQAWTNKLVEVRSRLCEIAERNESFGEALVWAERALEARPMDEAAWSTLFRLHADHGDLGGLAARFGKVQASLARQGKRFGADLEQIAASAVDRPDHTGRLSAGASDLLARATARIYTEDPAAALQWISRPEFRLEIYRTPSAALEILEPLLARSKGDSPERMQCMIYAMIAATLVNRGGLVRDFGEIVLRQSTEPAQLRAAATMMANYQMAESDRDAFLQTWSLAKKYAVVAKNEPGVLILDGQRAIFEWRHGAPSEAEASMRTAIERLADFQEHNALQGRASLTGYLGAFLAAEGRYEEATEELMRASAVAKLAGHSMAQRYLLGPLGLCEIMAGAVSKGAANLAQGVVGWFRLDSESDCCWALLLCVPALIQLSERGKAKALLAAIEERYLDDRRVACRLFNRMANRFQSELGGVRPASRAFEDHADQALVSEVLRILEAHGGD